MTHAGHGPSSFQWWMVTNFLSNSWNTEPCRGAQRTHSARGNLWPCSFHGLLFEAALYTALDSLTSCTFLSGRAHVPQPLLDSSDLFSGCCWLKGLPPPAGSLVCWLQPTKVSERVWRRYRLEQRATPSPLKKDEVVVQQVVLASRGICHQSNS